MPRSDGQNTQSAPHAEDSDRLTDRNVIDFLLSQSIDLRLHADCLSLFADRKADREFPPTSQVDSWLHSLHSQRAIERVLL